MFKNSSMVLFGVITLTLLYLSTTHASVLPPVLPNGPTTTNIQGPSTQSKIIGPDGSVIVAENPGGQIVHQETPGVFEPAGRILVPAPMLIPMVAPGEAARSVAAAGPAASGTYLAQSSQDIVGGMVGPRG